MKQIIFIIIAVACNLLVFSQQNIIVHQNGSELLNTGVSTLQGISFENHSSVFYFSNGDFQNIPLAGIDSVTFSGEYVAADKVRITWNENSVSIENPYAQRGISVTATGANVSVTANSGIQNIEYELAGNSSNGYITFTSDKDILLYFNNLQLTAQSKAAVKVSSAVSAQIVLQNRNTLVSTTSNTLTTNGSFVFGGNGSLEISAPAAGAKAIKADGDLIFNSGNFSINCSGTAVLTVSGSGYDPSYCTAIKADKSIIVNGGTINIASATTANGGKGLSADGDIIINSGKLTITTAGNGATYTNSTGAIDSYTASCIKSNGNIKLLGGTISCSSSGAGGKGITADGAITIGNTGVGNSLLNLTVGTSGARFLVSGSTGGGGRPGGGGGSTADYANPKGIKCAGNFTINSGTIRVNCTQTTEGGEGMESKAVFTINGGDIEVRSYDDPINGGTSVIINGGNVFAAARGNDAIDSNGSLTINGGLVIANGVKGDGEGIDSERTYALNGGTVLATSGSTMCSAGGPQKAIKYSSAKAGQAICIKNSSGETILMYTVPVITGASSGSTLILVFTDSRLVQGTYTLHYGGTISGGSNYNGYVTGGSYSGGSTKNFTVGSAAFTTVQ